MTEISETTWRVQLFYKTQFSVFTISESLYGPFEKKRPSNHLKINEISAAPKPTPQNQSSTKPISWFPPSNNPRPRNSATPITETSRRWTTVSLMAIFYRTQIKIQTISHISKQFKKSKRIHLQWWSTISPKQLEETASVLCNCSLTREGMNWKKFHLIRLNSHEIQRYWE